MARRPRHKSRRPKDKHRKKIPNSTKESVLQLRHMGHTYNQIASKTNLCYQSVEHIITKWAPGNPDRVKKARAKAMEELATRVTDKAIEALDNITKDSMTHDRVEQRDKSGKLIGVQHSGPNAVQLATMYAIMQDKAMGLLDKAAQLRGEGPDTLSPDDFATLLASIESRVTRLSEVKADIDTGQIVARVAELKEVVGDQELIPADYEVLEDEGSDSE